MGKKGAAPVKLSKAAAPVAKGKAKAQVGHRSCPDPGGGHSSFQGNFIKPANPLFLKPPKPAKKAAPPPARGSDSSESSSEEEEEEPKSKAKPANGKAAPKVSP